MIYTNAKPLAVGMFVCAFCAAAAVYGEPVGVTRRDVTASCHNVAIAHPNYHLVKGNGPESCLFAVPPSTFDPMAASQAELQEWGLPRRPVQPTSGTATQQFDQEMSRWRSAVKALTSAKRSEPAVVPCTATLAEFKGTRDQYFACGHISPDGQRALPRNYVIVPADDDPADTGPRKSQ